MNRCLKKFEGIVDRVVSDYLKDEVLDGDENSRLNF